MVRKFSKYLIRSERAVNDHLLKEMPYVHISEEDRDALFDFEFEIYPTPQSFLERLRELFDGNVHEDKYGNSIGPVRSAEERKVIVDAMIKDELGMVYAVASNKWKLKKEELQLLLADFLKSL